MKCLEKGWYKKVLHSPPHKTLYRGLKLNKSELAKLLDKDESYIEDDGSEPWDKPIKISNGHSSSWTFRKTISKDFSGDYGKAKRGFAITLVADTSDNPNRFLAGPGGLYDVDGLSRWHLEKETVGLEPIVVKRIEWVSIGND